MAVINSPTRKQRDDVAQSIGAGLLPRGTTVVVSDKDDFKRRLYVVLSAPSPGVFEDGSRKTFSNYWKNRQKTSMRALFGKAFLASFKVVGYTAMFVFFISLASRIGTTLPIVGGLSNLVGGISAASLAIYGLVASTALLTTRFVLRRNITSNRIYNKITNNEILSPRKISAYLKRPSKRFLTATKGLMGVAAIFGVGWLTTKYFFTVSTPKGNDSPVDIYGNPMSRETAQYAHQSAKFIWSAFLFAWAATASKAREIQNYKPNTSGPLTTDTLVAEAREKINTTDSLNGAKIVIFDNPNSLQWDLIENFGYNEITNQIYYNGDPVVVVIPSMNLSDAKEEMKKAIQLRNGGTPAKSYKTDAQNTYNEIKSDFDSSLATYNNYLQRLRDLKNQATTSGNKGALAQHGIATNHMTNACNKLNEVSNLLTLADSSLSNASAAASTGEISNAKKAADDISQTALDIGNKLKIINTELELAKTSLKSGFNHFPRSLFIQEGPYSPMPGGTGIILPEQAKHKPAPAGLTSKRTSPLDGPTRS